MGTTIKKDIKVNTMPRAEEYKYQSRILNPRLVSFTQDKRLLVTAGFERKALEAGLRTIRRLRVINEILRKAYGTPTLGNYEDPIDEFIYLTISQMTRLETARVVFQKLKDTFDSWELLLDNQAKAARILEEGGRGTLRLKSIVRILTEIEHYSGKLSLESLRIMESEEMEDVLISQLGIGRKTAYCMMIYSFAKDAFPIDSNVIRIFQRFGFVRHLVDTALNHKKLQAAISQVFPKDIGHSMHVNMVVHGRTVCRKTPECHVCPIAKLCEHGINQEYKDSTGNEPTAVDLFAGPGGFSLGFQNAGWKIEYAVEMDECAGETFRFNHPMTKLVHKDITKMRPAQMRKLIEGREVDALLAGVPCQGFSLVGYRVRSDLKHRPRIDEDPRNDLYRYVFRAVREHRPKVVVLENVRGMSTGRVQRNRKSKNILDVLKHQFSRLGYKSIHKTLDASKFGVPQRRKRLFVIGSRICDPNVIAKRVDDRIREGKPPALGPAISDLPELEQNDGIPIATKNRDALDEEDSIWGPKKPQEVIFGHFSRPHNEYDMEIIRALSQGMTYKKLYEEAPGIFRRRSQSEYKIYKTTSFHDKFYRLKEDVPSRTIVSHLSKDGNSFIHPTQNRSLTPREAARIQGFPDDYIFYGSRSSQFIQIGNAVPPSLAKVLGEVIKECLKEAGNHPL